jgi:hypothetical protein
MQKPPSVHPFEHDPDGSHWPDGLHTWVAVPMHRVAPGAQTPQMPSAQT